MIPRRRLLAGCSMIGGLGLLAMFGRQRADAAGDVSAAVFPVTHSDEEWRHLLSPAAYQVLRKQGTEAPWSSPLDHEHRKGRFACAGCGTALFSSDTKFDSGTGWPSFWQPLPDAVASSDDKSWMMDRTEIHCRTCGGHLGHVFSDGPKPTGLRYCMNGVALTFEPA